MLDFLGIPSPASVWDSIVDFFMVSPFWYYLFWGVVISAGATALAWFFPPLRSLAGAIVLAVSVGLTGYRRAEYDTEKRIKKRQQRSERPPHQPHPFDWFWGNRK